MRRKTSQLKTQLTWLRKRKPEKFRLAEYVTGYIMNQYNDQLPACYHKIPKIRPRAYSFQRPFLRGLFLKGPVFGGAYLRREICVSKLIGLALVFALFYSVFEGKFQVQAPRGAYIWRGNLTEGLFALRVWGLIHGGAYLRQLNWFNALHRNRKGQGSNPNKPFRLSFGNCISCVFIWDATAVFAFISTLRFAITIYEFMYSLFQNKHNYVSFLL